MNGRGCCKTPRNDLKTYYAGMKRIKMPFKHSFWEVVTPTNRLLRLGSGFCNSHGRLQYVKSGEKTAGAGSRAYSKSPLR